MLAGLKRYAAMKNSGVPWLGMVPEHWEVRRLKHAAQLNPSRVEAYEALNVDPLVTFLPMERAQFQIAFPFCRDRLALPAPAFVSHSAFALSMVNYRLGRKRLE